LPYSADITMSSDSIAVSAGSSRTVGRLQPITINAITFDDSYLPPLNPSQFSCSWSCEYNDSPCSQVIMDQLKKCSGNKLTGLLSTGDYSLGVSFTNNETNQTATTIFESTITVVNYTVPLVNVVFNEANPSAFSDTFYLIGSVDNSSIVSSSSSLVYTWSTCDGDTYAPFDLTNKNNLLVNANSTHLHNLKFAPGALMADAIYCFKLTVVDPAIPQPGSANIVFSTRDSPVGGRCTLSSNSLSELSEPLKFSCPRWVTDSSSMPLSYEFYVRTYESPDWLLAAPLSTSSYFSSPFSSGSYQIKAVVTDASGSSFTSLSSSFSVSSPPGRKAFPNGCITATCVQIANAIANYVQTQNPVQASKDIASIVLQTAPGTIEFNQTLDFTSDLIAKTFIDSETIGPFFATLLQSISGSSYSVSINNLQTISELINEVATKVTESGAALSPPSCLTSNYLSSMFSSIDQSLGSYSGSSLSSSDATALLNSLQQGISTMENCFYRKLAPQELPYKYSSEYLSRTLGLADTTSDNSFCNFNVKAGSILSGFDSVGYSCGTKNSSSYPTSSSVSAVNPVVYDMSFNDLSSGNEVQVSNTLFTMTVDSDLIKKYGIDSKDKISCSFYNGSSTDIWGTSGCSLVSLVNNIATCSCNHLTDFAITVPANAPTKAAGVSIGIIIGAIIGALLLVALIAGTIYAVKRHRDKQLGGNAALPLTAGTTRDIEAGGQYGTMAPASEPAELTEVVSGSGVPALIPIVGSVPDARAITINLPSYATPPTYEQHMRRIGRL
jgi:hypothetical protein